MNQISFQSFINHDYLRIDQFVADGSIWCSFCDSLVTITLSNNVGGEGKAGQQVRGGPSRHRRNSPRRQAGATLGLLTGGDVEDVLCCLPHGVDDHHVGDEEVEDVQPHGEGHGDAGAGANIGM